MSSISCSHCGTLNSDFNLRCTDCGAEMPESMTVSGPGPRQPTAAHTDAPDQRIGSTVGRYQIHERLGGGGMGVVYRATDLILRRPVALKFLSPALAHEPRAKTRMLREARAASGLDHPNIGTLFEAQEHEGQLFIAMALYEGETLQRRIDEGPMSWVEALPILSQIAAGLAVAHSAGIVHRDLKPANVMLTRAGQVKLLDFGLAKVTDSTAGPEPSLSDDGRLLGTVSYMAPEQARGRPVDLRADLWSLGVVAYEMLSGASPFRADNRVATLSRILTEEPTPLRKLCPEVPPSLERLILALLNKDAAARPESAERVQAALASVRSDEGADPSETSTGGGSVGFKPMRRWALAAAGLLAVGASFVAFRPGIVLNPGVVAPAQAIVSSAPVATRRSVAVLGFKNVSGQPEADWLSVAFSEMLRTELATGEKLRIVPGEDVARTKIDLALAESDSLGRESLGKIRSNLGADLVVLGSFLALGSDDSSRLRLDVRLQDTETGETLASVAAEGARSELFGLVSRTATQIRARLRIDLLTAAESETVLAAMPSSLEGARLYAEGLAKLRRFDALGARELLQQAVKVDPNFALAHHALAAAWAALGYDREAGAAAKTAFERSAGLSREARLLAEGFYRQTTREWDQALPIYRRLFELFPDNLEYGLRLTEMEFLAALGKDMMETVGLLRKLPPPANDDPRIDLAEGGAAELLLDFEGMRKAVARAAEKAKARGARLLLAKARYDEGWALRSVGRPAEALAASEEALALYTEAGDRLGMFRASSTIGTILRDRGDLDRSQEMQEKAVEIARELGHMRGLAIALGNLAELLYARGELSECRQRFDQAWTAWHELSDYKGGIIMGGTSVADVMVQQGDLAGAEQLYVQLLELGRGDVGSERWQAGTLRGYGDLLSARDQLDEARRRHEEAVALWLKVNDTVAAARSRIALLELAVETGHGDSIAKEARELADTLQSNETSMADAAFEPAARVVLARALLATSVPDAQIAVDRAVSLVDRNRAFEAWARVEIIAGEVQVAAKRPSEARTRLQQVLEAAEKAGWTEIAFAARLGLGKAEIADGSTDAGEQRLASLEREASGRGYRLIARKAAEAGH